MTNSNSTQISLVKEQNKFLARTYGWMALALIISGFTAFGTATYLASIGEQAYSFFQIGFPILAIAEIVLVWWLSASISKISAVGASVAFVIYSVLNGMTLSSIFIVYQLSSLFTIFLTSAGMFATMAIYGTFTKQNILSFGRYFFMALVGVVIASIINLFVRSNRLDWIISIVTVVLFTGLSAYDAQKMVRVSERAENSDVFKKASIIGALELYLDFVNIFLAMLRLFGKRKN
ncbi:MAG: Bax inhibitor-1/YccA family protein [Treponema sp.]|nr:Bax inhibitor-1/YccA family protein [Treponema sp.]